MQTNNKAAAQVVSKLQDYQKADIKLYHASDKQEGHSLGYYVGFMEQGLRHAVLKLLGVHQSDY